MNVSASGVNDDEKLSFVDSSSLSPSSNNYGRSAGRTQEEGGVVTYFQSANHPTAALFHILFKTLAMLTYVFGTWFISNTVLIFVTCVVLLAFDFWIVKNVTGRLLVGLRWENQIKEDGSNEWVFEAIADTSRIGKVDSTIFWFGLWISPILWVVLFVVGILKFNLAWLVIVCVALTLNGINLYGFVSCRKGAKKQAQNAVNSFMTQGVVSGLLSTPGLITGALFGSGGNNNNNNNNSNNSNANRV